MRRRWRWRRRQSRDPARKRSCGRVCRSGDCLKSPPSRPKSRASSLANLVRNSAEIVDHARVVVIANCHLLPGVAHIARPAVLQAPGHEIVRPVLHFVEDETDIFADDAEKE